MLLELAAVSSQHTLLLVCLIQLLSSQATFSDHKQTYTQIVYHVPENKQI